jgi:hypothetical protein
LYHERVDRYFHLVFYYYCRLWLAWQIILPSLDSVLLVEIFISALNAINGICGGDERLSGKTFNGFYFFNEISFPGKKREAASIKLLISNITL